MNALPPADFSFSNRLSMRVTHQPHHFRYIFVSTAGQINDHDLFGIQHEFLRLRDSVRALQSRNDSFQTAQLMKGVKRFTVSNTGVGHAATVMKLGVFRPDSRIIKTGGNGMRRYDLTIRILQDVGKRSVQDTGPAARKTRSVVAQLRPAASGFDADHLNLFVFNKVIEKAYRVATTTDTRHKQIGQAPFLL